MQMQNNIDESAYGGIIMVDVKILLLVVRAVVDVLLTELGKS